MVAPDVRRGEQRAGLARRFDDAPHPVRVGGHGLFDHQVRAPPGAGDGGFRTLGVRQKERGQVELFAVDHLAPIGVGANAEILRERFDKDLVGVRRGDDVEIGNRAENGHIAARMEMRETDNADR